MYFSFFFFFSRITRIDREKKLLFENFAFVWKEVRSTGGSIDFFARALDCERDAKSDVKLGVCAPAGNVDPLPLE